MTTLTDYYEERYKRVMSPITRVVSPSVMGFSLGTGDTLYSKMQPSGKVSTYMLTNHHVIKGAISQGEEWCDIRHKKITVTKTKQVTVEFFLYQWAQRSIGGANVKADIMTFDPTHDFGLLKLRDEENVRAAVKLYPRGEKAMSWLKSGMPVICVGCGLGEDPVQTEGVLSQFGREIDYKEYWLNTAPAIFGNSGGAVFLGDIGRRFPDDEDAQERQFSLIGVPSRIAVRGGLFGSTAITHLSYIAPISRIYEFLTEKKFRFIFDDDYTEEEEAELRKQIREEERYKENRKGKD